MTVRLGGRLFIVVAGTAVAMVVAACGSSSGAGNSTSAATIPHDTIAQLKAKANQEGVVNWYTTFSASDVQPMINAFNQEFPKIKINALRLSADQIPPRIITEQKGHKYQADVVSGDAPQLGQLQQVGALQPYNPPDEAPLPAGLSLPNGYTGVAYVVTTVISWNPTALKAAGLQPPTSWQDLTQPQWKGKFSVDPGSVNWYDVMISEIGHTKALALIKALGANDPKLVTSHTEALTQVEAGEPIASATTYGYKAAKEAKKNPTEMAFLNTNPMPASLTLIDVVKNAPHPDAAMLFEDWMVSRAGQQAIITQTNHTSVRSDVDNPSAVWDPAKWSPVWGTPMLKPAAYNEEVQEMNQAFGVTS